MSTESKEKAKAPEAKPAAKTPVPAPLKLSVAKSNLLAGLKTVGSVIGTKTTLPILSHILLETDASNLILGGTDLDRHIRTAVGAQIKTAGAITLPAKRFINVVNSLPGTDVELELKNYTLHIRSGGSHFELYGLDATEFPDMPTLEANSTTVRFHQCKLLSALNMTAFCTSTDESRYILQSNLFHFDADKFTTACTDGRRIGVVHQKLDAAPVAMDGKSTFDTAFDLVMPDQTVAELRRLLHDEGDLTLDCNSNQARFTFGDTVIFSKLLEGNYPNYQQVIPAEGSRICLNRPDLVACLDRVAIVSEKAFLEFNGSTLTITGKTDSVGSAEESMAVPRRDDLKIVFDVSYLTEGLKSIDGEEVYFQSADHHSPGVFTSPTHNWTYVVMPMRLS